MIYMKQFSLASTCWAIIFLIDYLVELFQINQTGTITTLTGLNITTHITPHELNTVFSLTLQSLFLYIVFVAIWLTAHCVLNIREHKEG
ncbi:hypothetical protein EVC35_04125 [Oenococcus sicerae]|uniref:Uncharacterized protein n=1 Tax=Oenococcus sicerae TaxID=2203724 RepID=A0AAJ1RCF2_9LACO|nr:hypothetical protein [Oenococcus sicerae]